MTTLLTGLVLLAVTIVAVRAHLRDTQRGRPRARATSTCPRCRGAVPGGADTCPSCRVPLAAFDLVTTRTVEAPAGATAGSGKLHALVRADVCVGCGACVPACPETGAITMIGKQAVIDTTVCVAHGRCSEACPVGGIVMASGEAVQRMEVPAVDVSFQSSVPGLYIVGELGGRGLIKNAINEGRIAVEHVAALRRDTGGFAAEAGILDVVIVGTGPAGLSAALTARKAGLSYVVLERGSVADTIRKYPRRKLLLAEPVRMPLYGELWVADASKESLLKVWESIIADAALDVRTNQEVTQVLHDGSSFSVTTADACYRGCSVVLAMGRRGVPRKLGVPGEDLDKVVYDVIEMEGFGGRRVLVVGAGDSAVESAVGLSRQSGCAVTLSIRGETVTRAKPRNLAKLVDAVNEGCIALLPKSQVREIQPDAVILDVDGATVRLPNDDVVVRIGGEPPYEFLKRVGVRLVTKEIRIDTSRAVARAG